MRNLCTATKSHVTLNTSFVQNTKSTPEIMSEQKKFNSFFQIQKYFKKLKTKNFGKYSIIFIIKPRF